MKTKLIIGGAVACVLAVISILRLRKRKRRV